MITKYTMASLESLLPCNGKLISLYRTNPSHPTLKHQIQTELALERQKIRVVLQFLLIKNLLNDRLAKPYKKRLEAIETLLETRPSTSCCDHGASTKTCDLTAEAGERFVKGGSKALKEWVKLSLKKVKDHQKKWKAHCQAKPMTKVVWSDPKEAYARLGEWAVAECLENQKKDLKGINLI